MISQDSVPNPNEQVNKILSQVDQIALLKESVATKLPLTKWVEKLRGEREVVFEKGGRLVVKKYNGQGTMISEITLEVGRRDDGKIQEVKLMERDGKFQSDKMTVVNITRVGDSDSWDAKGIKYPSHRGDTGTWEFGQNLLAGNVALRRERELEVINSPYLIASANLNDMINEIY